MYTLNCTLPHYVSNNCGSDSLGPTSLSMLTLSGSGAGSSQRQVLQRWAIGGREGQVFTLTVDLEGVWTVWVTTSDGAESCESNLVGLGLTTSVPNKRPVRPTEQLYDIAGRRVNPPLAPGVYFQGHRRMVVVR